MRNTMSENYYIKSVEKACSVMKIMCSTNEPVSLTELSKKANLHKATTTRILRTLQKINLVEQDEDNHKYFLGNGFLELSVSFLGNFSLRKISLPFMRQLRDKVGETVNLGILDNDEVIIVDRIESGEAVRHSTRIGSRMPAYCSALGKVIFAFMDREKVKDLLYSKPLIKKTPYTKTNVKEILAEIDQIQSTGTCFNDREHNGEVVAIGCPIFNDENMVIAAISISAPYFRINKEITERNKNELKKTAEQISKDFGWMSK